MLRIGLAENVRNLGVTFSPTLIKVSGKWRLLIFIASRYSALSLDN